MWRSRMAPPEIDVVTCDGVDGVRVDVRLDVDVLHGGVHVMQLEEHRQAGRDLGDDAGAEIDLRGRLALRGVERRLIHELGVVGVELRAVVAAGIEVGRDERRDVHVMEAGGLHVLDAVDVRQILVRHVHDDALPGLASGRRFHLHRDLEAGVGGGGRRPAAAASYGAGASRSRRGEHSSGFRRAIRKGFHACIRPRARRRENSTCRTRASDGKRACRRVLLDNGPMPRRPKTAQRRPAKQERSHDTSRACSSRRPSAC